MKTRRWMFMVAAVISFIAAAETRMNAANFATLGNATNFVLLSTGGSVILGSTDVDNVLVTGGEVGGQLVNLVGNTNIQNDAISAKLNANPAIRLANTATVTGECVTDSGLISLLTPSNTCGSYDATGTNALLTLYANAVKDVTNFSAFVANQTPNQAPGDVIIATGGSGTITTSVPGGLTVVVINDLEVGATGGNGTLTISGGPNDRILFNIFGSVFMYNNSAILLSGGITANNVVFNVVCTGASVEGSGTVIYNGTIVALGRRCDLGNSITVNGAVICGADISDGGGTSTINYLPATGVF